MKVLLVSPNIESLPDPVFPLGLSCIAAALRENKLPFQILDLCFARDYEDEIGKSLTTFGPDVVGLSLRNVDNVSYPNYISYLSFYQKVVQTIRAHSSASIVLGGSGFSLLPQPLMDFLQADFGIVGEGESAFVRLLTQIQQKRPLQGRIIDGYREAAGNLDALSPPDRSGFDNEAYFQWGGMGNIQTKRGCPFRCVYCTYPIIEGKTVRLKSPDLVCDEIEDMLNAGIDNLFFVDNAFNYPVHHAEEICGEIIRRTLPVKWSCYANPGFITEALVERMIVAGCTGVEFGTDAANEKMLKKMGKDFTVDDLKSASSICRKADMPFCHSVLFGGPGETMETVQQTLDTINEMSPTAAIAMLGIRIFSRTRLAATARKEGIISPDEDFLKPVFYLSPAIENKILPYIKNFARSHTNWIFPGLNINISTELQRKLRRFGIKGPLWEHMKMGNRSKSKNRLDQEE